MTATSSVQIKIGGIDYTAFVEYESVRVDNNIIMTSDTMDLTIRLNPDSDTMVANGQTVLASRPLCGQEIIWQNPNSLFVPWTGATPVPYREFGGVVVEVREDVDGMDLVYTVHAKSYEHWFNRHLVVAWYNQDNPENIIQKIVTQFCPSFTSNNVYATNLKIIPQYFGYSLPSDAIKNIADQLEYGYYIDYYKDVHFNAAETFTSPLPNNTLDVDNDIENYGDLQLSENGEQQYNKIILKGFKTRSSDFMLLTYQGDGQTVQWNSGYRLSSIVKPQPDVMVCVYPSQAAYQADTAFTQGSAPTFPQGGKLLTLKRDIVDGAPSQASVQDTAYIHYTQHLIRIPNFGGGTAIPALGGTAASSTDAIYTSSGTTTTGSLTTPPTPTANAGYAVPTGYIVAVRFHYMKDIVYMGQDPQAQAETAQLEGSDGVYEYAHDDKSLSNSTLAAVQSKATLMLMKYKFPQKQGTFTTFFNSTTTQGWRAGQWFMLVTTRRFGGINEVVFVHRVNKSIVKNDDGGLITRYEVQFADSPYLV